MSANYDFKVERGATWNRQINIANPPDYLPADFTGLTSARIDLLPEPSSTLPAASMTLGDGIIQDGTEFTISLTAEQTAALTRDHYHYRLVLEFGDSIYMPLAGKFLMNDGGVQ